MGGFGVSVDVGIGRFGLVSVFWGLYVVFEVVWLRTCVIGERFHALHCSMLSWLGLCIKVLRGFLFVYGVRVVTGDFMSWIGRSGVELGICGRVCGMVTSRCLVFFC